MSFYSFVQKIIKFKLKAQMVLYWTIRTPPLLSLNFHPESNKNNLFRLYNDGYCHKNSGSSFSDFSFTSTLGHYSEGNFSSHMPGLVTLLVRRHDIHHNDTQHNSTLLVWWVSCLIYCSAECRGAPCQWLKYCWLLKKQLRIIHMPDFAVQLCIFPLYEPTLTSENV